MPWDDRHEFDELDDALDRLMDADRTDAPIPFDADDLSRTLQQIEALDRTPGPDTDFVHHLMEDLMHATTYRLNGHVHSAPAGSSLGGPAPRSIELPRYGRERRWSRVHLYAAAALLLALGFGYFASTPFGGDHDGPVSLPAAVAPDGTPAADASPTAEPISTYGHPIAGIWRVEVDPVNDPNNIFYTMLDEDGTYASYGEEMGPFGGISVGSWRATGERTAELVFVEAQIVRQDLFDPSVVPTSTELKPARGVWRLTLTLDEAGNTMTSEGGYIAYDGLGAVVFQDGPWTMRWTRLIVDPSAVLPTPAP